jgi:uncharacterized membrane protein
VIEEGQITQRTGQKWRFGLTLGVVLAAIVLIIFLATGRIRAERARDLAYSQCIEQYDAMLRGAKEELIKGDINRSKLRRRTRVGDLRRRTINC